MIKIQNISKLIISYLIISVLCVTSITGTVSAVYDEQFFSSNDILFYNPSDTGCISNSSGAYTSQNSNINQETTARFLTSTNFVGNNNKPMNAVQMAAIMGNVQQESGFNPYSGEGKSFKGIVQWNSPGRWDNITDPKTDLNNQLNFLKIELDGVYKDKLNEFWQASNPGDINKATYAITRNYEVAINPGKDNSSTTWTNSTDAVDNVQDWLKREGYASGFYDQFGNLASSGYTPGSSCGRLVSGGMTLEKAKSFMNEYRSLKPINSNWLVNSSDTIYALNNAGCSGGPLANCVTFSQYFINRYTNEQYIHTSNGDGVVKDLIALGLKDGGHTPKAYSVFSATFNHTGVVLGVDQTNNKIIIGEASCGFSMDYIKATEYNLSDYSNNIYTYAYTDDVLKGGSL